MNLSLDSHAAKTYSNNSQVARVLTENWVKNNAYCPNCGNNALNEFKNNQPVADFFCNDCNNEFELKAKQSQSVSNKIVDGAYSTMIQRITSNNNPNFFFLTYDKSKWHVTNFLIIPNYYFVPDIIEQRKPLAQSAKRAGWIGCNIDISKIPNNGKVYLIEKSIIIPKDIVEEKWRQTQFLKSKKHSSKGWIIDIMNCIDSIKSETFTLKDMYRFEDDLKIKYPENNYIKDKIRQQLQLLRDKGLIEFIKKGHYKKRIV